MTSPLTRLHINPAARKKGYRPVKIVEAINLSQRIFPRLWVKNGSRGRISAVTKAPIITAIAKAIVPSSVFFVRGQCRRPYFFPIMLACCQKSRLQITIASPHPRHKTPLYPSIGTALDCVLLPNNDIHTGTEHPTSRKMWLTTKGPLVSRSSVNMEKKVPRWLPKGGT